MRIRPTQAYQLGIGVGKKTSLQERVIGKVYSGNNVAWIESNLLRLREEVVRIAVERHLPTPSHRHQFFWNQFCGIEQIEIELVLVLFIHDLYAQFPFREIAVFDGFPQIAPVKVRVFPGNLLRFIPSHRVNTQQGLPVELHETTFACPVDESERVDTEAFHHAEASRNSAIRHDPHDHMHRFGHQ